MPVLSLGARRLLAVAVVGVVAVILLWHHSGGGAGGAPSLEVRPVVAAHPGSSGVPATRVKLVVVDVAGAVRRAGLVRLATGSRVADAIARAGGFTRSADRAGVNLAAPVSDGQQVLVPSRVGGAAGASAASSAGAAPAGPVSLSAATPEQLDALPGVGPVTAQKIVQYRTQHGAFHTVDELDAIPGIGPARIAQLQGLVVP
jgi:competence protein ComEA